MKVTRDSEGRRHSFNDKPAMIGANGAKYYFKNGERHRDGDKPAVIWADGTKCYYKNDVKYTPKTRDKK